ncbi:MAG: valine--tRNA ligase [Candidatus Woesearchaeota archaeon]
MDKNYDFQEAEPRIRELWEKEAIYKFNTEEAKTNKIFSIDTPPPTVSGEMHLGHAVSYAQEDFVARYKKMRGYTVFYPFGTDDNGLPTERLVEKLKKVRCHDMERTEFIQLCLKTLEEIRPKFVQDWKNLGMSCDFSIFYSTIDDHCRKISQKSFIGLYKMGREYQKEAPTIWCPRCQTAIAQVELEDKEIPSMFNDIVFKFEDGKELIIATTRPELLSSCLAVFVHPDDKRYKDCIGKKVKVPIFDLLVPIMADEKADPEKGTGAVMCCSFGDMTDIEWVQEHNLQPVISITKDGKMKAKGYEGLTLKQARKKIIEDMKEQDLLRDQKPVTHPVNAHERCGTEVEFLVSRQWFIKYLDLKEKFLKAGNSLKWYPAHMKVRYDNWVKGLKWDWCISRQRHFGVPFPVWYCNKCKKVKLAEEEQLPIDPLTESPRSPCECGSNDFTPEKDVLDTWATSSLTPQIAASLKPELYNKLYPMDLRPNAHDIITFWLFNTVAKSMLHNNVLPWKDAMISGFVLDPKGKKMSKSKGNAIHPQDIMEKYGSDALRFAAAATKLGDDMPFQEKEVVSGKKTVTKLWNASKFSIMNLEGYSGEAPKNLEAFDIWLLTKLNKVIREATATFENYEYSKTKHETEKFFWQKLCDNYLEIIKERIYNPERGKEAKLSAQYTLYNAVFSILRLFAPIMPYITEEIYQIHFRKNKKSIHLEAWPEPEFNEDKNLEEIGDRLVEAIALARKKKSEKGLSLKEPLKKLVLDIKEEDAKPFIDDLKAATKAQSIEFGDKIDAEL